MTSALSVNASIDALRHASDVPSELRPGFSGNLAGVRAIAAVFVVFYHCVLVFNARTDDGQSVPLMHFMLGIFNGTACVTLFFVLSGTVLSIGLDRSPVRTRSEFRAYVLRRAFRLFPTLIVAALACAVAFSVYVTPEPWRAASPWFSETTSIGTRNMFIEFLKNASALSFSINGPAWSIRVEVLGSLLLPILFAISSKGVRSLWICTLLTVLIFLAPGPPQNYSWLNFYLLAFFVGVLIYRHSERLKHEWISLPEPLQIFSVVAAILLLMFARTYLPAKGAVLLETLSAGWIVIAAKSSQPHRILSSTPLLKLADWSYSLYLMHMVVLLIFGTAVLKRVATPSDPVIASLAGVGLGVGVFIVTTLAAALIYECVERPAIRWGRILSAPDRALSTKPQA